METYFKFHLGFLWSSTRFQRRWRTPQSHGPPKFNCVIILVANWRRFQLDIATALFIYKVVFQAKWNTCNYFMCLLCVGGRFSWIPSHVLNIMPTAIAISYVTVHMQIYYYINIVRLQPVIAICPLLCYAKML